MSEIDVIVDDLKRCQTKLDSKANAYGEDLGAPYREAAVKLQAVIDNYE